MAYRMVKDAATVQLPAAIAEVHRRLRDEGLQLATHPDWTAAVEEVLGRFIAGATAPEYEPKGAQVLAPDPEFPHVMQSPEGVVLMGCIRAAPLPDPRLAPVPSFEKKKQQGLSRSAIKDFLLAHTAYLAYQGRLNVYEGRYANVELADPATALPLGLVWP